MAYKRLTKSEDRFIGGVCGGIAEFFEIDPTLVRIGYTVLTIFSAGFPGVLLYLILCIIVPSKLRLS